MTFPLTEASSTIGPVTDASTMRPTTTTSALETTTDGGSGSGDELIEYNSQDGQITILDFEGFDFDNFDKNTLVVRKWNVHRNKRPDV